MNEASGVGDPRRAGLVAVAQRIGQGVVVPGRGVDTVDAGAAAFAAARSVEVVQVGACAVFEGPIGRWP